MVLGLAVAQAVSLWPNHKAKAPAGRQLASVSPESEPPRAGDGLLAISYRRGGQYCLHDYSFLVKESRNAGGDLLCDPFR